MEASISLVKKLISIYQYLCKCCVRPVSLISNLKKEENYYPRFTGDIVVDNELHLWDVETSAGHVRRDQHLGVVRLELGQRGHTLLLRLHAVQGRAGNAKLPGKG